MAELDLTQIPYGEQVRLRNGQRVCVLATRRKATELIVCDRIEFSKSGLGQMRVRFVSADQLEPIND